MRITIRFDSHDREVERLEYRDRTLTTSRRYMYDTDARGNWIKKTETLLLAQFPQFGFNISRVYYRDTEYFGEQ